jgi:hypothetical protein
MITKSPLLDLIALAWTQAAVDASVYRQPCQNPRQDDPTYLRWYWESWVVARDAAAERAGRPADVWPATAESMPLAERISA